MLVYQRSPHFVLPGAFLASMGRLKLSLYNMGDFMRTLACDRYIQYIVHLHCATRAMQSEWCGAAPLKYARCCPQGAGAISVVLTMVLSARCCPCQLCGAGHTMLVPSIWENKGSVTGVVPPASPSRIQCHHVLDLSLKTTH